MCVCESMQGGGGLQLLIERNPASNLKKEGRSKLPLECLKQKERKREKEVGLDCLWKQNAVA